MVTLMHDDIDPQLLTLFAQSSETLPGKEFIDVFWARLERARRVRTLWRIALAAALAILGAWVAPTILGHTASAVQASVEYARPLESLIVSPAGWAVSTLIGFVVLIRAGALRRR
jgi:hypothetical protein